MPPSPPLNETLELSILIIISIVENATALGERRRVLHRRFCQFFIEPVMFEC